MDIRVESQPLAEALRVVTDAVGSDGTARLHADTTLSVRGASADLLVLVEVALHVEVETPGSAWVDTARLGRFAAAAQGEVRVATRTLRGRPAVTATRRRDTCEVWAADASWSSPTWAPESWVEVPGRALATAIGAVVAVVPETPVAVRVTGGVLASSAMSRTTAARVAETVSTPDVSLDLHPAAAAVLAALARPRETVSVAVSGTGERVRVALSESTWVEFAVPVSRPWSGDVVEGPAPVEVGARELREKLAKLSATGGDVEISASGLRLAMSSRRDDGTVVSVSMDTPCGWEDVLLVNARALRGAVRALDAARVALSRTDNALVVGTPTGRAMLLTKSR